MRVAGGALLLLATAALSRAPAREGGECSGDAMRPVLHDTVTSLSLDLNVPAFRVVVRESGAVRLVIPVATGRNRYQTPIGDFGIDYVVWNPPWTPPPSPWARKEKPQKPGPDNWMGRVKLHFTEFVFMHGSPFTQSFGTAASHACVRMSSENAMKLARLVHRHASPGVPDALLDSLVADDQRTRSIALTAVVPVHVRYELAEVRDGQLELYPDVYPGRGTPTRTQALAVLSAQGVDSTRVDRVKLAALVRQSRRKAVTIPVDSLLTARAAPPSP